MDTLKNTYNKNIKQIKKYRNQLFEEAGIFGS
jgi:hypothetical protein